MFDIWLKLRRAELDNERKRLDEEKGKISGKYGSGAQHSSGHKITPVPPLLDNLNYPNDDINLTAKPTECYVGYAQLIFKITQKHILATYIYL